MGITSEQLLEGTRSVEKALAARCVTLDAAANSQSQIVAASYVCYGLLRVAEAIEKLADSQKEKT
jgi:hypothetical protein